jgi:hypothetical protein
MVTIEDGVWIGNLIIARVHSITTESLTTTTDSHNWVTTPTESPLDPLTKTNSAEFLARAQDLLRTHFTVSEMSTQDFSARGLLARTQDLLSQTDYLNSSLKTEDLTN